MGVQEEPVRDRYRSNERSTGQISRRQADSFSRSRWLSLQEQYEPAARFLERAIALDASYAPAWNRLAYCHAYSGDYSKAFAAMERYVTLLPSEPNPQNSYAEILRMSGNSRDALEHYSQALKIDPAFHRRRSGSLIPMR